ncbi:MAG: hypothetical protein ACREYD_01040 [Casimicrobiaceae bacterium]
MPRTAAEVDVVEYQRGADGDYFLTADAGEVAALDTGAIAGWVRTGQRFHAYAAGSVLQADQSPVCRFYGRPEAGQHSHFFSAYADECAAIASWLSDQWLLESANVFVVSLPGADDGSCAPGTVPVYRLYNNAPASVGHRYTTSAAIQSQMMAAGWVAEGFGPDAVAMCAPAL